MACVTFEFDPFVGVRVGEARLPGPGGHFNCLDEEWEAVDEEFEEPLVEDIFAGPPMDPARDITMPEDDGDAHDGARRPVARVPKRRRTGGRYLPPLPLAMGAFYATPCFQGIREGYVFTTEHGATGYYREEGRQRQPLDAGCAELAYLAGVLDSGGKVAISLEELLPQPTERDCWQSGQKRATRLARAKREPRRPPPTDEVDQQFGTRTECQTKDNSFRGHGLVAIDTVNPNASSAALEYLERSAADAVVVQELRTIGPRTLATQRAAQRAGWHLSSQHADTTEKDGVSAGVGVSVRSRLGLAVSPAGLPKTVWSRFHLRWVGAWARGGFHLGSMYLRHSEGASEANLDLLQQVAGSLRRVRGQWLIGGDFNMSPEDLAKIGWLSLVQGVIHRPHAATCGAKEFEFFVSSRGIAEAVVATKIVADGGFYPHSPVRIFLKRRMKELKVRVLRKPSAIAAMLPQGCAPDCGPKHQELTKEVKACLKNQCLDQAYGAWISALEDVAAGIEGTTTTAPTITTPLRRRCDGPATILQPALGPPGSAYKKVKEVTRAWRTAASWLLQIRQGLGSANLALRSKGSKAKWKFKHCPWTFRKTSAHSQAFLQWVTSIAIECLGCRERTAALHAAADGVAKRAALYDERRAEANWHSWLREGPGQGLGRQHRISRVVAGWIPTPVGHAEVEDEDQLPQEGDWRVPMPLHAQAQVDGEARKWAKEWACHEMEGISPAAWPSIVDESLPALTTAKLREAAKTFPTETGLGWDQVHPRILLRCSEELLEVLVGILTACEALGMWPAKIGVNMICLIPKACGGLRPIGLMPMVVRLWMRARLDVARGWQGRNDRPYLYAGPGKGAVSASWKQAAWAEFAAQSQQLEYAVVLLDLVKAFERIQYWYLVQQALKYGYSITLLRLSIASYQLARVVGIGAVLARPLLAGRGITAGSVFATIEMRIVMIEALDVAVENYVRIMLTCYVDDVAFEMASRSALVQAELTGAVKVFAGIMRGAGMEFSPTKNVVAASTSDLRQTIAASLVGLRVKAALRVVSLGTALGAGRRRTVTATKRVQDFRKRIGCFRVLKKAKVSVARILKTGGVQALTFGQCAMGVSDTTLQAQRRSTAASLVATGQRGSLDLTLALAEGRSNAKLDPAFPAHLQPLCTWAEAVWCGWLPRSALMSLMRQAKVQGAYCRAWSRICGPASAVLRTAARLKWVVHDAVSFTTDEGFFVHLERDSPAYIQQLVTEAVIRWRNARIVEQFPSMECARKEFGPHLGPILSLLEPRALGNGWSTKLQGALRSAVTGRQWTQQRLFSAGLADTGACMRCVRAGRCQLESLDPAWRGTLVHRYCDCPHLEPLRASKMPRDMRAEVARARRDDGTFDPSIVLFHTRCLINSPLHLVPKRPLEETFRWLVAPDDGYIVGVVYTDGSLIDGDVDFEGTCARLGWSFLAIDDEGRIVAAACGCPPAWVTTIYGAELWAIIMAARCAFPGGVSELISDCESVVKDIQKGSKWAVAHNRVLARAWAAFWATTDDDQPPFEVVWMPAHTPEHAVGAARLSNGRLLTHCDRDMNAKVDEWAKEVAKSERAPLRVRDLLLNRAATVRAAAVWVAIATEAANADERDSTALSRPRRGRKRSSPIAHPEETADERLLKHPRIAALRLRIFAKTPRCLP